jgi:glycosyltransferase involved in cell wall biosynthesis
MKILIVTNLAPFIWGGAEELAENLNRELNLMGHQSEIFAIPFQWEPSEVIPSQILMVLNLKLTNVDHVIALKFPAYFIEHPSKKIWLLHQFRQAYDLWDSSLESSIRDAIRFSDNVLLPKADQIYCNSEVTKRRLLNFNGIDSQVLYPPVNDPELFVNGDYGDYIFAGGRMNNMKRQHLLIEALRYTKSEGRLYIVGPPDDEEYKEFLISLVEKLQVADKVEFEFGFLPRERYAQLLRNSLAVAYIPFDEDSLGYVSMEAAEAGKAVITATDSGGILGLSKNDLTGIVAEPNPVSLALALDEVFLDKERVIQLGKANQNAWKFMNINWSSTLEKLLP